MYFFRYVYLEGFVPVCAVHGPQARHLGVERQALLSHAHGQQQRGGRDRQALGQKGGDASAAEWACEGRGKRHETLEAKTCK